MTVEEADCFDGQRAAEMDAGHDHGPACAADDVLLELAHLGAFLEVGLARAQRDRPAGRPYVLPGDLRGPRLRGVRHGPHLIHEMDPLHGFGLEELREQHPEEAEAGAQVDDGDGRGVGVAGGTALLDGVAHGDDDGGALVHLLDAARRAVGAVLGHARPHSGAEPRLPPREDGHALLRQLRVEARDLLLAQSDRERRDADRAVVRHRQLWGCDRRRDGAAQHPRIGADRDARAVADGALRWSRWSRRWAPRTGGRGRTLLLLLALPALLAVPASPAAGARACLCGRCCRRSVRHHRSKPAAAK